ncbi:fimbrial protein [Pragia fontium]|uniref:fimbrial protein n=1 Tax=Pragia fontium TaxID=82985 RepID=UPI001F29CEBA|nr:fimbrial protein [Pragia fontium]
MSFHGILVEPPPCKINDGAMVDVNFERVGVNKVDGVNYLKTLDYNITCEPGVTGLDMTLLLSGQKTSYDDAAVQTDLADLGIRVLQNGQPFTLDTPIKIDPQSPPTLTAVPVKTPGATLTENAFSASATLLASYQ